VPSGWFRVSPGSKVESGRGSWLGGSVIQIQCPACKADLSKQPLSLTKCPICDTELHIVIDLSETTGPRETPSVLVVDDDKDLRQLLVVVLEQNGFELAGSVSNGPDAVLLSQRRRPDYVILDTFMPAISGGETARLIREVSAFSVIVAFSDDLMEKPAWADLHLAKANAGTVADLLRLFEASESRRRS
jgi:CheY-like chemotaxis protein